MPACRGIHRGRPVFYQGEAAEEKKGTLYMQRGERFIFSWQSWIVRIHCRHKSRGTGRFLNSFAVMRFISSFLSLCSVCCLLSAAWGAGDMAPDLKSGVFWNLRQPDLFGKYFNGEAGDWVDKDKTQLRIAKPAIKIGNMPLGEMLVHWKEGVPQSMTIMMYNKGDNGAIDKDEFEKRLDRIKEGLTELAGVQPKEYRASRREAVVKVNGWSWIWDKGAITLEINTSKEGREFEAEFIRLKAGPTEASIARGDASSRAKKADVKQHVRKEGKRVVIQDIPMVDQGQKGYCVVATAARIFAYYGMDYVDQHELASLANSSADGGTSTKEMAENMKKIGARFQIRIKVLDSLTEIRDFRNLLKAYNRAASKLKKEKVEDEYDWSGFWDNADGEVLKLARAGSPSQVDRWLNAIKPYISAGIPVLWSVQLGLVPEPMRLSQTRGGHLRLIIGFDEEKKTLIFSDSWGAAHTEKEMPLADAIAITTGRQVMQPSK